MNLNVGTLYLIYWEEIDYPDDCYINLVTKIGNNFLTGDGLFNSRIKNYYAPDCEWCIPDIYDSTKIVILAKNLPTNLTREDYLDIAKQTHPELFV